MSAKEQGGVPRTGSEPPEDTAERAAAGAGRVFDSAQVRGGAPKPTAP